MVRVSNVISRRKVLAGAVIAPFAGRSWLAGAESARDSRLMLVGTQTSDTSKGIYAYKWNPTTGELDQTGVAAETSWPTFICSSPDGRFIYSVHERSEWEGQPKTGAVSSFAFDRRAMKLTLINTVISKGAGPCHISVDQTGRSLFVANYDGGSAASFLIGQDGKLSEAVSEFHYEGPGPNKERQEAPHAHRVTVTPDNRHLLVNDLGLDLVHIYDLDPATAKLTTHDPADWKSAPGAGPRALRFHPNKKWAYVATEMGCTVSVLAWDPTKGTITTVQDVPLLADNHKNDDTGSELVIDRSGRHLYSAVRSDDFVAHLTIDQATGKLTLVDRTPCGKIPRHMTLDPTERWLLVADQDGDAISVLRRDTKTGALDAKAKTFPISHPQCLLFV